MLGHMAMSVCDELEDQWPVGNTDMGGFHWHLGKHCFLPCLPRREKSRLPFSSISTNAGTTQKTTLASVYGGGGGGGEMMGQFLHCFVLYL